MLSNTSTVPQLRLMSSAAFKNINQILHNMVIDYGLYRQHFRKSYFILICNSPCEFALPQINLPTAVAAKVVRMHPLLYCGHVEYNKATDTRVQKLIGAREAPWCTILNLVTG